MLGVGQGTTAHSPKAGRLGTIGGRGRGELEGRGGSGGGVGGLREGGRGVEVGVDEGRWGEDSWGVCLGDVRGEEDGGGADGGVGLQRERERVSEWVWRGVRGREWEGGREWLLGIEYGEYEGDWYG